MPTYQYTCTECGEPLEVVQSFSDDPLTECPACSGRLRKVFSAVGVVFKGSGFYHNDSRTAANGKSSSSTAADGDGAKKSESASDSNGSTSKDSSSGSNSSDGSSSSSAPATSTTST